jgi:predicted GTPase
MATLNILFLGETDMGKNSIIDVIAGQGEGRTSPNGAGGPTPRSDVREVQFDNKTFLLHIAPTGAKQRFQDLLRDLRKNGGPHLLVYCLDGSQSTSWIEATHSDISSCFTLPFSIPTVAVVTGVWDLAQQEIWWSDNQTLFADRGVRFAGHAFIPMMSHDAHSPSSNHISESRRTLHALVIGNCAGVSPSPNSENNRSDAQYQVRYAQRFMESSLILRIKAVGKPSPTPMSNKAKAMDVVLLGETGVGKSSVINLIAGKYVARVSHDTMPCTETTELYIVEEKGRTFHLHDTPGLIDPPMGVEAGVEAYVDPIDKAQKLIRSLNSGNGPDLLLFCVSNKPPTAALQRNYRLFSKIVCGGKVPFALVITHLGKDETADGWWKEHAATIRNFGIKCSGHTGLRSAQGRSGDNAGLDEDSEESRESIFSLLVTCADLHKHNINRGLLRSLTSRAAGRIASVPSFQVSTLMRQCGLDKEIARNLVGRLAPST